jgi:hypothetical protein
MNNLTKTALALSVPLLLPLAAFASTSTSTPPTPTYTVTIDTYIDGKPATADALSANNAAFPMNAWWSAKNIGIGKGDYTLSTTGFNSSKPYEAVTAEMTQGANYNTRETLSWTKDGVVSGNCRAGTPFVFQGYTWGNTLAEAAAGTPTTTSWPRFSNMTSDKYVIVWNKHCLTEPVNLSPVNGASVKSADLSTISWSPVTDPYGTVSYIYEASNGWQAKSDGSFVNPIYTSGQLSTAQISAAGTPPGSYYYHVMAVDSAGNKSFWGHPFHLNVK